MPRQRLIEVREGTAAEWAAANTTLALGEPGWDSTNNVLKIGDGVTAWAALSPGGSGSFVPKATASVPISPGQFQPASGIPTFVNAGGPGQLAQGWSLDADANEAVLTTLLLPTWMTHVSIGAWWWNPGVGAGSVVWRMALVEFTIGSGGTAFPAGGDVSVTAVAAAQNVMQPLVCITNATLDPNKAYSVYIQRLATDPNDTLPNDAVIGPVKILAV